MHHDFVRILWRIERVAFTPIVTNGIGKDIAGPIECCCCDGASYGWIALEPVFGNSVPKVKGSVGASSAEGAVLRVEGDGIDRVDIGHVTLRRIAMAFEGEV